jgi:uncharacterized OsmC-like protein
MKKRIVLTAILGTALLTAAQAQQNDQRLNRAITDAAWYQKAVKSAPGFRDLLARRKAAVEQFRAIPTSVLQPVTIRAFATAEQRAGTRHVIIREHEYFNDSGYNNGGYDFGIGTPDHVIAAIAGDIIDSYVTQAAIKGVDIDSLAINIKQTGKSIKDWGLNYTIYIDSPASDETIESLRQLAEQHSPLYQFAIRAHNVNTIVEHHQSAENLVIPPTYQPGLREFIEWETRKAEGNRKLRESGQRPDKSKFGGYAYDYPYSRANRFTPAQTESYLSPDGPSAFINPSSGVTVLQVRHHRVLQDHPLIFGGNDLGPTAVESHIGLLGSCFTHVAEGTAARNKIPVDTINVALTAQFDPRAGRKGFESTPLYPTNIEMRVVISSPRSEAVIKQLVADTERGCPIYNLVVNAQKIVGRIERVKAKNK